MLLLGVAWAGSASAQSSILLRLRNPTSLDRLVVDSAGGLVVFGTLGVGTVPSTAGGPRMMWYPAKAAFRALTSTSGDPAASIGLNSAAFGIDNQATGTNSFAIGNGNLASGVASIAAGYGSAATNGTALALGYGVQATGPQSVAFGIGTQATAPQAMAVGSTTLASGSYSLAAGDGTVASGSSSLAAGLATVASGASTTALGSYASTANHAGAYVYGDASTATYLTASADNQFSVRASGGVRFFTNNTHSSGVTLSAGGSAWNVVSDRNRKEAFLALNGEDMLARIRALPLTTWRYIAEADRDTRHIGPMAQDWHRAFGFSRDSLTINSGDLDGVNLAGVQALEARTQAQAARIAALEAANRALLREHAAVLARLKRLESAPPK
jgi:autotransporter adhesin